METVLNEFLEMFQTILSQIRDWSNFDNGSYEFSRSYCAFYNYVSSKPSIADKNVPGRIVLAVEEESRWELIDCKRKLLISVKKL